MDDPHIERPLVRRREPAVGFYVLLGESVITFPADQTKERICEAFEAIREQNPPLSDSARLGQSLLTYLCKYTRRRATQLGIDLIFLPVGSLGLNPIESVWKSLKWELSPLVVESTEFLRALVAEVFELLTRRVSFDSNWITQFFDLQKL